MKIIELKKILEDFPDDMEIWVSDNGYCEGGTKLLKVEKILAYEADLDGDDIDDEYFFIDFPINVEQASSEGYVVTKDGLYVSKEICYLSSQ